MGQNFNGNVIGQVFHIQHESRRRQSRTGRSVSARLTDDQTVEWDMILEERGISSYEMTNEAVTLLMELYPWLHKLPEHIEDVKAFLEDLP